MDDAEHLRRVAFVVVVVCSGSGGCRLPLVLTSSREAAKFQRRMTYTFLSFGQTTAPIIIIIRLAVVVVAVAASLNSHYH